MYLLGITGRARAGKDTAAHYFLKHHGYTRAAFADPLKDMAAALTMEPLQNFHDDVLKEQEVPWLGLTRRRIMQLIGNDAMKPHFGNDLWSRHMQARLDSNLASATGVVISDVRFDHEAQTILDRGGYILQVCRAGSGLSGAAAAHSSEAGINPNLVDFTVDNDGSIGELNAELEKIARFIQAQGAKQ